MIAIIVLSVIMLAAGAEVNIVVVGETGVGKSTFINGLFGRMVAEVGKYDFGTLKPTKYVENIGAVTYNVWDTRGFNEENDAENILDIFKRVPTVNLIILCFDLYAPRFTRTDNKILDMFEGFNRDNIIIVFTKKNLVTNAPPDEIAEYRFEKYIKKKLDVDYTLVGLLYGNWTDAIWSIAAQKMTAKTNTLPAFRYLCKKWIEYSQILHRQKYPDQTKKLVDGIYEPCVRRIDAQHKAEVERQRARAEAERRAGSVVFRFVSFLFGLLAAPFTGGASIVLTGLSAFAATIPALADGGSVGDETGFTLTGVLAGMSTGEYFVPQCENEAKSRVMPNQCHRDQITCGHNVVVRGQFCNRVPHGEVTTWDENGEELYRGAAVNGQLEICQG